MKKQKRTDGSIFEIPINNGEYYVYGQILPNSFDAFFDFRSTIQLTDFSVLLTVPILFRIGTYRYVIGSGEWLKVGKLPIRDDLKMPLKSYIYHSHNNKYELYDCDTGNIYPATKEMAKGLENCAVWTSEDVEDRIKAHYIGAGCLALIKDYELFGFPEDVKHNEIMAKVTSVIFVTTEYNRVVYNFELNGNIYERSYNDFNQKYKIGDDIKIVYSIVNPAVCYCADEKKIATNNIQKQE